MKRQPRVKRTAAGLRDALFDEIEELRGANPDPEKSRTVAQLAGQIINATRLELEFHTKTNKDQKLCDDFMVGTLKLGDHADVAPAAQITMDQPSEHAKEPEPVQSSREPA
jgi:hypothetical protein